MLAVTAHSALEVPRLANPNLAHLCSICKMRLNKKLMEKSIKLSCICYAAAAEALNHWTTNHPTAPLNKKAKEPKGYHGYVWNFFWCGESLLSSLFWFEGKSCPPLLQDLFCSWSLCLLLKLWQAPVWQQIISVKFLPTFDKWCSALLGVLAVFISDGFFFAFQDIFNLTLLLCIFFQDGPCLICQLQRLHAQWRRSFASLAAARSFVPFMGRPPSLLQQWADAASFLFCICYCVSTLQPIPLCSAPTVPSLPWQCLQYSDGARDCPDAVIHVACLSLRLEAAQPAILRPIVQWSPKSACYP